MRATSRCLRCLARIELRKRLGTKVRMNADAKNRGKIEIEFYDLDDLERILDMLRS